MTTVPDGAERMSPSEGRVGDARPALNAQKACA